MRRAAILHLLAGGWLLAWGAVVPAGCGPSIRRAHLADEYFERCYAGDRDPRYRDEERRRCWDGWLGHHSLGQREERIAHARERLLRLSPERAAAVELATGEDAAEEAETHLPPSDAPLAALTALATGADVEPPREPPETPALRARHRPLPPRASSTRCDASCLPPWNACIEACAERDRPCVNACRARFRICAAGCY